MTNQNNLLLKEGKIGEINNLKIWVYNDDGGNTPHFSRG